jgi:uncharacterized protein
MTSTPRGKPALTVVTVLASVLYSALFTFRGAADFWWWMGGNVVVLVALASLLDPEFRASVAADVRSGLAWKAAGGLASAAVLYGIFLAGGELSRRLVPFAGDGIRAVYVLRDGQVPLKLYLLLGLVIGPGEELIWRGCLQRSFQGCLGPRGGLLVVTVLYTAVHLGSYNPMLVAAAAVAGLFWGWLYLRFQSIILNVVSHTVWDLAVFLLFPLQ